MTIKAKAYRSIELECAVVFKKDDPSFIDCVVVSGRSAWSASRRSKTHQKTKLRISWPMAQKIADSVSQAMAQQYIKNKAKASQYDPLAT